MAEEKREQVQKAASDPTADGILVGLEMALLITMTPEKQRLEDQRADAQIELRQRWLRLRDVTDDDQA